MTFEYMATSRFEASIEIESIGNVCLIANTDEGATFGVMISSVYGRTDVTEVGPVGDKLCFPFYQSIYYSCFDYSDTKIKKIIENFINRPKYNITQVRIADRQEVVKMIDEVYMEATKE